LVHVSKEAGSDYCKLFCEVGAKLIERLGSTNPEINACCDAALCISYALERRVPSIYPPADGDLGLEHPDFRRFQDIVRRLLPLAEQLRDWERGYISWHAEQRARDPHPHANEFILRFAEERVRSLDALVDLLTECCPAPPAKKHDARSRWHSPARYFAPCIEDAFWRAGIESPSRSSALSPLVPAVQDLLKVAGYTHEPDAIRKVLGKSC